MISSEVGRKMKENIDKRSGVSKEPLRRKDTKQASVSRRRTERIGILRNIYLLIMFYELHNKLCQVLKNALVFREVNVSFLFELTISRMYNK